MTILDPTTFKHHIDTFNTMEPETVVNYIPNAGTWDWMTKNIPFFECSDPLIEQMYYFRWWVYRKHIVQTPKGFVVTEFLTPVKWATKYNAISCALGHHLAEGRWLHDQDFLDKYVLFWFRNNDGKPDPKFHSYSSWAASAIYDRAMVTGDHQLLFDLLNDLVADYQQWETERLRPDGLFWQFDVRDGMEESISGSRTFKNARPTINTYMYANALAIATIAGWVNQSAIVDTYNAKAAALKKLVQEKLWDKDAKFFKAETNADGLCDAREELGFIPWMFRLPDAGFEDAWAGLTDPKIFWAPMGITTAERDHPKFRTHGVGQCEWDGSVWPFATSQTLNAMANLLRHYEQSHVSKKDYLATIQTYAKSMHWGDKPYIGEYLDEKNGAWLKGDNPRSRYYNHSTFCDLIISGLVGICPRADSVLEISPLLPNDAWDWFCLDNVPYHGKTLTILWDRDGKRYGKGAGFSVYANGRQLANMNVLGNIKVELADASLAPAP